MGFRRGQSQFQRACKSRKRNVFNGRPVYGIVDSDGQFLRLRPEPADKSCYGGRLLLLALGFASNANR